MIMKKSMPLILPALLGVLVIWWLCYSLAHSACVPHHYRTISKSRP
jgi:hypothetical protein